ncbi:MAG: ABC transporter substrate-binding protein [Geobacteraceae bacterium]|nr:ABC transporter substrate-binding protein [Geobacteraceae bacterium]
MTIHVCQYAGRTAFRMLLLIMLISAGGGCSRTSDTPDVLSAGKAAEKISICQGGGLAVLPLIAQEKGLFSRQGVSVEIVVKGDGRLAMDALLAGECTFATLGEPPLVTDIFTRTDYAVLATLNSSNNATKVIARRDLGISTVGDLKGRPVGVRQGTMSHYFLDLLLSKNGIRSQEVRLKFMEPGRLPEALAQGEIVAYSGADELLLKGRKRLVDKAAIISAPGLCLNFVNLVARKDFVSSHPETISKLLTSLLQAEEFSVKHPDEVRKIVQRLKDIPETELNDILTEQVNRVTLPQSLLLTLEGNARWMIDNRMVKNSAVPNFLNVIDPSPLKALKPSAVSINR